MSREAGSPVKVFCTSRQDNGRRQWKPEINYIKYINILCFQTTVWRWQQIIHCKAAKLPAAGVIWQSWKLAIATIYIQEEGESKANDIHSN